MGAEILLILGVLVLSGGAYLALRTKHSNARTLPDADAALQHWNETYPDLPAHQAMLSNTKEAALIRHSEGMGLVWGMTGDFAVRRVEPGKLRFDERDDRLIVTSNDGTLSPIPLVLSADEIPIWRATLDAPVRPLH